MSWLKPWTWGKITTLPTPKVGGRVQAAQKPSDRVEKKPERRDLAKIVEDMRGDYQVTFCERILFANIGAIAVSVTTENEALTAAAEKLQTLWDNTLATMGDTIAYGRVAYELEWDDGSTGHQLPKRSEALPFRESRMKLCEGHFDGIEVKAANGEWLEVDSVNAWWLAIDATVQRPHGQSRFLDAPYEVWKDKAGAKKNRTTATSKWALRGPIVEGPITDFDEQTGQNYDVLAAMTPAIETWSKGGMLYLPNDQHPQNEGERKFRVIQADLQGFDPNALNATIERLDVEMARAFGIAEQTIMEAGGVGTYGSITQKMLLLFAVCEGILDQWVRSFEKYVVGKVEDVNGLPRGSITLTYTSLSKRPDAFIFEAIKLLLGNPEFVTAIVSGVDVGKLLEDAGFPVTEQMEAALAAAAQRLASASAAGAPLPTVPAGEMAGLGRRQWQNNRKAINDVLGDMIAGTTSEVMARELLQSLGVPAERAQVFIGDAKDGKVDDPELGQPAALAQVAIPRQGFKVPDTAQVLNAGLREFDRLFDELVTAMSKRASQSTLNGIRKQIVTLEAELRTAGRLLGMLSPWQPRAVKYAGGTVPQQAEPMPMTLADNGYKFPWMEDAVSFLESKGVVTAAQFATMTEEDRRHVFSAPGIDTVKQLKTIQTKLAKSLADGDDLPTFRKSIEQDVALTRSQTETMYRTETKRGYVAGLDKALAAPLVRDEFPAVMFSATSDQRVRDDHWDLDGFVTLRNDPAYRVLKRASGDYNCRCALIPLSAEDAESYGVKTYSDLPADVRAKYG